jgi:hypothetical protein
MFDHLRDCTGNIGSFLSRGDFITVQNFVEQQVFDFYTDPVDRSDYVLNLLERRINNLHTNTGTEFELTTLTYLDIAVDQATTAIASVIQAQGENIRIRLLNLAQQANEIINKLTIAPVKNQITFITFQTKLQTLLSMVGASGVKNNELSQVTRIMLENPGKPKDPVAVAMGAGGLIPFPPDSAGAVHAFYPLIGQHELFTCNTCHSAGKYLGSPNTCTLCHILKRPNPHYDGDCSTCHAAVAWNDIHLDHQGSGAVACKT